MVKHVCPLKWELCCQTINYNNIFIALKEMCLIIWALHITNIFLINRMNLNWFILLFSVYEWLWEYRLSDIQKKSQTSSPLLTPKIQPPVDTVPTLMTLSITPFLNAPISFTLDRLYYHNNQALFFFGTDSEKAYSLAAKAD